MSLNRASSCRRPPALLLWLLWTLWVLLLPSTVTSMTGPGNSTLLFDSAAHGNSLRNCSCSTYIQDCDEALANLLCSCRTVSHSELTPGGLRAQGSLTMWLREPWVLTELLNGSVVPDLRLSYCGAGSLAIPTQYLALFGLRRLRVHSAAQGAPHPEQVLTIASGTGDIEGMGSLASTDPSSSVLHVSFLDVAVLNCLSSLKAYSVSAPPMPTLSQYFPHLPLYPSTTLDQPLYPSTALNQPLYPSTALEQPLYPSTPLDQPLYPSTPLDQPLYPSTPLDQPLYPSTPLDQPLYPQQDCLLTFIY